MHIAIDARQYSTSTGRYNERNIHYLAKIDHENTYTILLTAQDYESFSSDNPNFHKVLCPYKEYTLAEQLGFAKQLYGLKADLVHFGMTQQPLLYFKKSVTTIHDLTTARFYNPDKQRLVFWIKQQIYKVVIWYAAHKSKQIIVPTEFVANDLVNYTKIPRSKINVTYESADKETASTTPLKYLQNTKFIMYVGRPAPHKNLDRLGEAFRNVSDPSLRLVLVGKTDRNFENLKARCADEKRIIFTGFVNGGELRWLYEHATAYIFPSLSEGFGLPGLEAMRYDLPLASSDATCLPEVYGDAALYFDPLNVAAITEAITKITTDGSLRQTLIKAGQAQRQKYSWQKMSNETVAIYKKALS